MSKGPLDKQDKKAGENGGSLIIAATETNGLEQLSVVSNGGNGSDGTNGVDGTSLIRSQGFTRSVETAVCDEGMHEIYTTFGQQHKGLDEVNSIISRSKQREKEVTESILMQHVGALYSGAENNVQSGYADGSSSGASFTIPMQNYGNSFPSQGHNYARYMVDDDHRSERPPRPICKRPANLCHCLCDHNPDSTTICDCACCVNDAFVSHMLPSGLVQLDSLENFDITNLIPNEQNHDEDIVYGRRESPPNSSPETQNQCVNTSLPQHVPQPMTQNDYPYEDPNLSSGARSFPQPLRGRARGRPRSSNQPSAVYMRGFNANRSQRALFVQQLIQRLDEFRPEERQIIEELMAAAGIGHSASSQRGS